MPVLEFPVRAYATTPMGLTAWIYAREVLINPGGDTMEHLGNGFFRVTVAEPMPADLYDLVFKRDGGELGSVRYDTRAGAGEAVLVPIDSLPPVAGVTTDLGTIGPSAGSSLLECAQRGPLGYEVPQDTGASLKYVYTDQAGNTIASLASGQTFGARIADAICPCSDSYTVAVTRADPDIAGDLRLALPDQARTRPGIYRVEVAVRDADGRPLQVKQTLVSVEPSLFGADRTCGPITIGQVRTQLRDVVATGQLVDGYEYGIEEVLTSIMLPIDTWNKTPPFSNANAQSFPFRTEWLDATVARLLMISTHYYLRQGGTVEYEGAVEDNRNKYKQYAEFAERKWDNYLRWVSAMKRTFSRRQGYRAIGGIHG